VSLKNKKNKNKALQFKINIVHSSRLLESKKKSAIKLYVSRVSGVFTFCRQCKLLIK